ncbi:MAG: glucosylglycerol hydrolase, partial [Anaerolineae bacterium]|nr:glucosylglycerol hydrolase [Anaerolineae bacterium]
GAKDVGDWGDKGDVVKCNTIYYGWRTSPDGQKQVFLIANMEGQPIERCPLNLFLNLSGSWQVAAHSPTMSAIPAQMDKSFVISNFKNGEALLLERTMTPEGQANSE